MNPSDMTTTERKTGEGRNVEGIARELMKVGVDFSRVDYSKLTQPTDAELDAIFEDLR